MHTHIVSQATASYVRNPLAQASAPPPDFR